MENYKPPGLPPFCGGNPGGFFAFGCAGNYHFQILTYPTKSERNVSDSPFVIVVLIIVYTKVGLHYSLSSSTRERDSIENEPISEKKSALK